jgi:hypothetical protein
MFEAASRKISQAEPRNSPVKPKVTSEVRGANRLPWQRNAEMPDQPQNKLAGQ